MPRRQDDGDHHGCDVSSVSPGYCGQKHVVSHGSGDENDNSQCVVEMMPDKSKGKSVPNIVAVKSKNSPVIHLPDHVGITKALTGKRPHDSRRNTASVIRENKPKHRKGDSEHNHDNDDDMSSMTDGQIDLFNALDQVSLHGDFHDELFGDDDNAPSHGYNYSDQEPGPSHRQTVVDESDNGELSDSDMSDQTSETESDDDSKSDSDTDIDSKSRVDEFSSSRFNPLASLNKRKWTLEGDQVSFCNKYFGQYVGESVIKKTILKKLPCPNHDALKVPKLDADICDLLPTQAKNPTRAVDGSFRRVQGRLLDTMGPLGKLWVKMEEIARHKKPCDMDKLMTLVEQAIIVLGQTNVLITHNRRLNVLSRFLKDTKSAGEIIRQNEANLNSSKGDLFGPCFYKALHRRAKGHKHGKEIRQELGSKTRVFSSRYGNKPFSPEGRPRSHKPFRKGPSSSYTSSSRGARTFPARGRGGHRTDRTKNRYVDKHSQGKSQYRKTQPTNPNETRPQTNNSSRTHTCSVTELGAHRTSRTGSKVLISKCSSGRKITTFCDKLGHNHTGPLDPTNSTRLRTGINRNPSPDKRTIHTKVLSGRVSKPHYRDQRNDRKTSSGGGSTRTRSVRGPHVFKGEEKQQIQANIQSKTTEYLHFVRTLQNGGHDNVNVIDSKRGLHVYPGSKRRILRHVNLPKTPKISKVLLGTHSIPIQSATLWFGKCP